jgi:uncharacterized DUF497 family protein
MSIRWDEPKRQEVLARRNIDFAQLDELFLLPYVEDQRNDDPEQYRLTGFVAGRLVSFIIHHRISARYTWRIYLGGHSLEFDPTGTASL